MPGGPDALPPRESTAARIFGIIDRARSLWWRGHRSDRLLSRFSPRIGTAPTPTLNKRRGRKRGCMATNREVLDLYSQGQGILCRADDDEPVFILRAQDKFFVPLVRLWTELVAMDTPQPVSPAVADKLMDAVAVANSGIDWQNAHPQRVKVPD